VRHFGSSRLTLSLDLLILEGRPNVQSTPVERRAGPLVLAVAESGSTRTISAKGEMDLSNAGVLQDLLEELHGDGAETIVLDLQALEFIDSTGLALLINWHNRLNDGRLNFRLIPSRALGVCRVMDLTGLTENLPFLDGSPPR
jgi:anti-anti-sigma factor